MRGEFFEGGARPPQSPKVKSCVVRYFVDAGRNQLRRAAPPKSLSKCM